MFVEGFHNFGYYRPMLVKIKLNAMHEQIPAHASIGNKTSQKWNEFLFIFDWIKMKNRNSG